MRHLCLLLLLASCLCSCTVGETITLNKDLSGTKVIEFELPDTNGFMDDSLEDSWEEDTLEDEKEDTIDLPKEEDEITEEAIRAGLMEAMGDAGTDIAIIEQLFAELDNISNYKMEQDDKYLRVSFNFNSDQPQIGDKQAYNLLLDQLSDGTKWYFKYIPNTFSRVSRKEIRWNILNVDLFSMDFKEYQAFSSEMGSATMLLTVHFAERIKSVDQPNIIISPDRRSLKCKIELSEISDLKRSSQVLIRFQ
ncbi:hypothetical protein [Neolewinella persica]|uniref:hypothetical protein n=1 Tax=Neolewinella persica TaxID=70998 RepID=UPI00037C1CF4|nr:hypothetical protein [Neolewinella persica]